MCQYCVILKWFVAFVISRTYDRLNQGFDMTVSYTFSFFFFIKENFTTVICLESMQLMGLVITKRVSFLLSN